MKCGELLGLHPLYPVAAEELVIYGDFFVLCWDRYWSGTIAEKKRQFHKLAAEVLAGRLLNNVRR